MLPSSVIWPPLLVTLPLPLSAPMVSLVLFDKSRVEPAATTTGVLGGRVTPFATAKVPPLTVVLPV